MKIYFFLNKHPLKIYLADIADGFLLYAASAFQVSLWAILLPITIRIRQSSIKYKKIKGSWHQSHLVDVPYISKPPNRNGGSNHL
jgi:hypothetical protein